MTPDLALLAAALGSEPTSWPSSTFFDDVTGDLGRAPEWATEQLDLPPLS